MKKLISSILIISISLVILFLPGCAKPEKLNTQNASKKKVDKFIEDINKSIKRKRNFNYKKKIKSYNLTDKEYIEVQNKLSEGLDDKFFNKQIYFNSNSDDNVKFCIIYSMKTHFITQWYKNFPKEEIVFNKILPIIKESNDMIRYLWLDEMGNLLMDIHNKKLPFSEEHRTKTMDELISIFTNEGSRKEIKNQAFDTWTFGEIKEDKIYEVFNILVNNDEDLFMIGGRDFSLLRIKAPELYSLMFNILENRQNYSNKILLGALSFFRNAGIIGVNKGDLGIERRMKLKRISQEIIESKNNKEVNESAKEILYIIELGEKEGEH